MSKKKKVLVFKIKYAYLLVLFKLIVVFREECFNYSSKLLFDLYFLKFKSMVSQTAYPDRSKWHSLYKIRVFTHTKRHNSIYPSCC